MKKEYKKFGDMNEKEQKDLLYAYYVEKKDIEYRKNKDTKEWVYTPPHWIPEYYYRIAETKPEINWDHVHPDFDYLTDNSLVCTELLFKAYEPVVEAPGLKLPLEKIGKHLVTPANAFAQQFSQTYNTDRQQMDLVLFMDGYEKSHSAVRSDVATFLTTWKRPKWHIIQQTLQSGKP